MYFNKYKFETSTALTEKILKLRFQIQTFIFWTRQLYLQVWIYIDFNLFHCIFHSQRVLYVHWKNSKRRKWYQGFLAILTRGDYYYQVEITSQEGVTSELWPYKGKLIYLNINDLYIKRNTKTQNLYILQHTQSILVVHSANMYSIATTTQLPQMRLHISALPLILRCHGNW